VLTLKGPKIDPSLLKPLLFAALALSLLFLALHLKAMQNEILRRRVKTLQMAAAQRADRGTDRGRAS
jgi:heme exporter protein C